MRPGAVIIVTFFLLVNIVSAVGEENDTRLPPNFRSNCCPLEYSDEPKMEENAAHFKYFQNDSHVLQWYEWWYMNVKGDDGTNLLIEFFTFGNLNNPLASAVGIFLIFMTDEHSFESIKAYPGITFNLDYEKCNVTIDGDTFLAVNNSHYTVTYHNSLNDVSIVLNLTKRTRGIRPISTEHDWQWMKWLVPVPDGRATGLLEYTTSGRRHTYEINGRGYHDHNYGIAKKRTLVWDWGEFSDYRYPLSISYGWAGFGDSSMTGGLYVADTIKSESLFIPDLHFEYMEWITHLGIKKPAKIYFHGKTANLSVELFVNLKDYYVIGVGEIGLPYLYGEATGTITFHGRQYTISANGFYEHHFFTLQNKP
jgi:hypothetical protein